MRLAFLIVLPGLLSAQLVSTTSIPKGPNLPVVFVNGYQIGCVNSSFSANFGKADQVLQASQIATVFFDNCSVGSSLLTSKPSIEALGIAFGQFLGSLRYTDGSAVPQVDVVAHSMGGLIVRSYLAGKQDVTPAAFHPPATPLIRKAVFLATPHFGTYVASYFGSDTQTQEMSLGSQFLFDLNSWNDTTDDLRGVDALAVAGSGGTGLESTTSTGTSRSGFDDGVVTLTSASIGFARTGRTRVVPDCHSSDSLLTALGACPSSAQPIAQIADSSNPVGQIIVSFLTGTTAWQSIGTSVESTVANTTAGLILQAEDQNGAQQAIKSVTVSILGANGPSISLSPAFLGFLEALAPGQLTFSLQLSNQTSFTASAQVSAATSKAVVAKPGPTINGAVTAGSAIFPLGAAANGYVAIFGANLTTSPTQTLSVPYPLQAGDVQVLVNGTPAQIQFISAGQINMVYPNNVTGLTQLTVKTSVGQQTVNVLVPPAIPSIFTLDGTNNGPAAALDASVTSVPVVSATAPLHGGDYVELYLTGLGQTARQADGLDWTIVQPTVTVGGQPCKVTYAGLVYGYTGFDQINCIIPSGVTGATVPIVVTSSGRSSNAATLTIK